MTQWRDVVPDWAQRYGITQRQALALRRYIRFRASAGVRNALRMPIYVRNGDAAPTMKGEAGYWTNKKGERIRWPSSELRDCPGIYHVEDTRTIVVGEKWIRAKVAIGVPRTTASDTRGGRGYGRLQ